jgi:Amt family ammonium transporter
MSAQFISQLWGVLSCIIWSGTVSFIAFKFVDIMIGLRVSEESEREGLDISEHGETAYQI